MRCSVRQLLHLLGFSIYRVGAAGSDLTAAHESRHVSTVLAGELRQSSDDLTRLARTYVVSGDALWEQQYFEVLDIRNGKKPRPPGYEKIYWDFRAANVTPAGPGHEGSSTTESLMDRMKAAGFSESEFAKLKEAAANSDDLVKTETIAMNLVKGQYEDGQGGFSKKGEPDLARAQAMMHDANYHTYKAKIMKPVDEFLGLLDQRTAAAVATASAARDRWYDIALASIAVLVLSAIGSLVYAQSWIRGRLGAEPGALVDAVQGLAQVNWQSDWATRAGTPNSVFGACFKWLRTSHDRWHRCAARPMAWPRPAPDCAGQPGPAPAHRTAGQRAAADRGDDGAARHHRATTTPTTPSRPTNWPWVPRPWPCKAATWSARWSPPCRASTTAAARSATSSA